MQEQNKTEIPVWEKATLTIEEAAAYSNIGVNTLKKLTGEKVCDWVLHVGNRRLIKRKLFEKYIDSTNFIDPASY